MSCGPRGTDQRGAPVESPGRETFKRLKQKRSRGRSSPIPREAFHNEKSKRGAKINKPQINNGDSFDKTPDASKTRQMRKANEKAASGTLSSLRRLLTSAELSAATGRGREPQGLRSALLRLRGVYSPTHYYVRVSRAVSFTGAGLLHRLRAFLLRINVLHRCLPSSQAPGLFRNAAASQAFAFFTGSRPFPKRDDLHRRLPSSQALGLFQKEMVFTGVCLLHRLWAFPKKGWSSQAFAFFT